MSNALTQLMSSPLQMYLAMIMLCVLPTYFWRGLGVAIGSRIDENGGVFQWVKCVASATIFAVVVRLLVYPVGDLAAVSPFLRYGAFAAGILVMLLCKRSVEWGLVVGVGLTFVIKMII